MIRPRFVVPLNDGGALSLGERTLVMAIINVTPDSFADGGVRFDAARAMEDGVRMVEEGADILDVGGESTRPGAEPLPEAEELRRVLPVIEGLRARVKVPISVDTYKASVADRALDLGATIVNDISALTYDPELAGVVARRRAAVVLMHNRGRSSTMYAEAKYADVMEEICAELSARVADAERAGIAREHIIVDPGLGFAKAAEHTIEALAKLDRLAELGLPVLSGPSRKSFLKTALGEIAPAERDWGTAGAVAVSILKGAHIVRVHNVSGAAQVARVVDLLNSRS